jgi:hypothetical protein
MSDPMTNMGADDVLASVRRLVSETYDPQLSQKAPVARPERFILSPDLRVVDAQSGVTGHDVKRPLETPSSPRPSPLVLTTQIKDEAPVSVDAPSLENSQDLGQKWPSAFDDTPDAQAVDHAAKLTLEERIAELESAVESQAKDWDSDGSDDFDDVVPQDFSPAFLQTGARILDFRSAELATHISAVQNDALNSSSEQILHDVPEVKVATAEAETPASQSRPEDLVQEPRMTLSTSDTIAEASVDEELALAGYSTDELLDEDALRDMIAVVIREELQGVLGERITRNVRRLVRREVQRVLTLREFD